MKKIFLIVATVLLVAACGKDDVNEPNGGNQLEKNFPFLKIGNSWTYGQYITYAWDGSTDTNIFTLTLKRKDMVMSDDDTTKYNVYFAYANVDEENDAPLFFAVNDSDGTLMGGVSFSKPDLELPFFRKSYTVGQSWGYWANPDQYISKKVISIDETVTVEAGTFYNCIKIEQSWGHGNPDFIWLRNDIGTIKAESQYDIIELKSKNF